MKLNRTQQRYASVLGLCLTGLLLDKTLLRPGEAKADTATAQLVQRPSKTEQASPPASPLKIEIPQSTMADRFEEIAEARNLTLESMPDAFGTPNAWLPENVTVVTQGPVTSDEARIAQFVGKHHLNAVMANGDAGYAIVDGKRLQIGEVLDGFRLVAVHARSVALEAVEGGARAELKLPERSRPGNNP